MSDSDSTDERPSEFLREFDNAPFHRKLGAVGTTFERGRAVMRLDHSESNTTLPDRIHGGAILALIDCAATAAAWTTIDKPEDYQGTTVGLTTNFIAPGRSQALSADARIVRQGRTLTHLECVVTDADGGTVAKALITYKLSRIKA